MKDKPINIEKCPDYMNTEECMVWLGTSRQTIQFMRREKGLPIFRLGNKIMYSKKAIDEYIHNELMEKE